jgi:hypothetical protein
MHSILMPRCSILHYFMNIRPWHQVDMRRSLSLGMSKPNYPCMTTFLRAKRLNVIAS